MLIQELKGVAEAEVRSIDLWNIRFEADRALYLEDDIPAAMHIKNLEGNSFPGSCFLSTPLE